MLSVHELPLAEFFLVLTGLLVMPQSAAAEWMIGGFIGGARSNDTSLTVHQPAQGTDVTFSSVHFDSASLDMPIYYGYRAAWFPRSRWLGVEGELIHLKAIADTARITDARGSIGGRAADGSHTVNEVLTSFSITHGVNLLLVNAVARKRGLIGRLGIGRSVPHAESAAGGATLEEYEWGALSLQASGGAETRLTTSVYATVEYKLTRTVQDVSVVGGSARTPLVSHHLAAGLAIRLGARPARQRG